jgi:hypothetical protein
MIAASSWAAGARDTVWFPVGYTLSFLIVAFLSVKYGEGPLSLHLLDRVSLAIAVLSAAIWWSLQSPVASLLMNICTEFVALIPTIVKAYRRPWTEERVAWGITGVASLLNLLAISNWTFGIALYPVYAFITNAVIIYPIMLRNTQ